MLLFPVSSAKGRLPLQWRPAGSGENTSFCETVYKNHDRVHCSSDQTSVWFPCEEPVLEPETEAKTEQSSEVRPVHPWQAEKTQKHVFLSKTVQSHLEIFTLDSHLKSQAEL